MNEELRQQIEALERNLTELRTTTKRALGFVNSVQYRGIAFNVSRRFVIADLAPLAFFHLIEPIDHEAANSIESAVTALYDRLFPLLTCTHRWTRMKRSTDGRILAIMGSDEHRAAPHPHICKSCTGYALEHTLPRVGRSMA